MRIGTSSNRPRPRLCVHRRSHHGISRPVCHGPTRLAAYAVPTRTGAANQLVGPELTALAVGDRISKVRAG